MSFLTILETILIGPLKLIFEIIFVVANRFVGHPGLAIICLSLLMNILVLPLYRRADAMQEEARDIDARLRKGVDHIKKTFSGDEKMMILQAYYRQNNYKPTDALNGSVSLLLEIPFFMAAYQFLSKLDALNGVSFGPIADLGAADGLIVIGGIAINLLPVLMTSINVISSALYLKGFPVKAKIQLYGMAAFFLVFLYNSPAGLVFYWTLNNVFSLVKTIFYKLKNPRKVLAVLLSALGVFVLAFGISISAAVFLKRRIVVMAMGILMQLPVLLPLLKSKLKFKHSKKERRGNKASFFIGALFLTVLTGLYIPSGYVAASPQEYVALSYFYHPLWHVLSSLCLAGGAFIVWMGVFYWLASPGGKHIFEKVVWIMCAGMLINYMFFGTNLGTVSSALVYHSGFFFTAGEQLLNLAVLAAASVLVYVLASKKSKAVSLAVLTALIALSALSLKNVVVIKKSIDEISFSEADSNISLPLSTQGKNVVIIMLDRAMGEYVPYILNEKPELKEVFSGFTYYENVISHGNSTNFGIPALMGGYEYTPVEMNKRDTEPLVSKHNEALKLMPVLFDEQGYNVTVCDPPYANYQWIPDLSIYDEYPNIKSHITEGKLGDPELIGAMVKNNNRNLFCFSIMKTLPLVIQPTLYDEGRYNQGNMPEGAEYTGQRQISLSQAEGIVNDFMVPYNVLIHLPEITQISAEQENTFLFLANDTTHEPMLLQAPEYVPSAVVDNREYDAQFPERFSVGGRVLNVDTTEQMAHYHANMASLLRLGEWFDYMREMGVYDNTRIIIASDHGRAMYQSEELLIEDAEGNVHDMSMFYPLLMVKDFDSSGFNISDEFMTNADVPSIAVEGLIDDPKNPFTGKALDNSEKFAHQQFITMSGQFKISVNNGNSYLPSAWASVKDSIWNKDNWTVYEESTVLNRNEFPN